jgi:UDPglucose 6-dehydrogenase
LTALVLEAGGIKLKYMKTIGIIGQGFVGSAVNAGMQSTFNVLTYDKYLTEKTNSTPEEIVEQSKIIFVCVPTPMNVQTGEAYLGIVESVVDQLEIIAVERGIRPTLVVKSTVPPGTIEALNQRVKNAYVTFNPEFLTEANAINDFINQDRIIIGSDDVRHGNLVANIFGEAFPNAIIKVTTSKTAEMVKYTTNCFLAVKVAFANEMYDLCKAKSIEYDEMIELAKLDKRLGNSHWKVPGPDGDRGYGGHCFPKDMEALRYFAEGVNLQVPVIRGAIFSNNQVRNDRDWEAQEGRAVINIENEI